MILRNDKLLVRRLNERDANLMVRWLSDPRVLVYVEGRDRPHDLEMVRERYLTKQGDPVLGCIVEYDGSAIGYIQFYPSSAEERVLYGYPDAGSIYGIDLFIGEPELWGRGIGTSLVTATVEYLFSSMGTDKIVIDPQAWNTRAVRCYEKSGFKKVKYLPQHELHEGVMRDCWLMEQDRGARVSASSK